MGTETNISLNREYPSSAFKHNSKHFYNLNANATDEFNDFQLDKQLNQGINEVRYTPTSIYDNNNGDFDLNNSRQSRQQNQWQGYRKELKRDNSMPPIRARERGHVDDNLYAQYPFTHTKYSIDGDLDTLHSVFNGSGINLYDSVITNVSITPPPVHIVNEYANKKAIIRPLAFRPIQLDRSPHNLELSPTKPPVVIKNKVIKIRRISPPPVPPHANRVVTQKLNLGLVQSLKSGDSSGYYSSRNACTTNGNTSSTDISPTFDDNGSMMDSIMTGEIYANTLDLITDYQVIDDAEQGAFNTQVSLATEIAAERERNKVLESALSQSNINLLNAESKINELKLRLSQKSSEIYNTKENLILCKRSLEHQSQKCHNLESSIQSIKYERSKEKVTKDKITQANLYNGDNGSNQLLEQFEEERRTWLDEKLKVLTYQKQIETNFQSLLIKSRRLESQLLQHRNQLIECRSQHEQNKSSSLHSTDSSTGRHFLTNINRIESTEHQASF